MNCDETTFVCIKQMDASMFYNVDAFVAVPGVYVQQACREFPGHIKVCAQDVSIYSEGAYTGEIGAKMFRELGVVYALVGHSERRIYFNENNEDVSRKLANCLQFGLSPVLCIGESVECRERGDHIEFLRAQLVGSLGSARRVSADVAYEPVWAIGSGRTAGNVEIQEVAGHIRAWMDELELSGRILYGGAVSAASAGGIGGLVHIDGVLVGGASLTEEFGQIAAALGRVEAESETREPDE